MLPLTQIVAIVLDGLNRKLGTARPTVLPGLGIGDVGAVQPVLAMTVKLGTTLAELIGSQIQNSGPMSITVYVHVVAPVFLLFRQGQPEPAMPGVATVRCPCMKKLCACLLRQGAEIIRGAALLPLRSSRPVGELPVMTYHPGNTKNL